MSRVAVVGGATGVGRTIVEEIAATKKHVVFVFTRNATDVFAHQADVFVVVVDYSSPSSIAQVLRENEIDTIISTAGVYTDELAEVQFRLIDAAVQCGTVKRNYPLSYSVNKNMIIEKLEQTSLEFTRFIIGTFMDYYGHPHAPTYLLMMAVGIDVENAVAALPGDGNVPVTFTYSADVGKFVAAALDLPQWPTESFMAGDKLTFNEMVKLAEKARGRKFEIHYDPVEKLKAGQVTELPANVQRYAVFAKEFIDTSICGYELSAAEGWFDLPKPNLNELLPHVKPMTAEQFLNRYWEGK
ncbi:uncharacterized protein BGW36DRAFT_414534 [Neofusicoccum parvum]|uniref:Uncharacterized protein BGW36DRAFT_414534 n=1 Tax=Neofusicoccum parvum TaxID=310453 RepID=A0ACB5SDC0_9PEZI|nr:uncharacterized protein BGW36DRAFT_414534 [Neofusicoccum parvum]